MINAKEAHELSMSNIPVKVVCDTAIKDAARAGQFAAKVSLKDKNFTDREVWETMKELDELGYHMYPHYRYDRMYINLDELKISWR